MLVTASLFSLSSSPQAGIDHQESRELGGEVAQDLELQGLSAWPIMVRRKGSVSSQRSIF